MDTGKELIGEIYKWEQETTKEENPIKKIKYLKNDIKYIQKIKYLRGEVIDFGLENKFMEVVAETCDIAIDAIESLQKFDKIIAEIEALPKTYPFVDHIDAYIKVDDIKKILDKYESESEDKE